MILVKIKLHWIGQLTTFIEPMNTFSKFQISRWLISSAQGSRTAAVISIALCCIQYGTVELCSRWLTLCSRHY